MILFLKQHDIICNLFSILLLYCRSVINDLPLSSEASIGVPSYPLYKRLALSLYHSMHSGALCTSYKEVIPALEELNLRKKDDELNKMIMEKGSALLSVSQE